MLFTLRLVARSGRWVAPAIVYVVWLILVLANPGPSLTNAASMFFAVVIVALWITVIAGNVDDDPHRDLCAAVSGSPARLHASRTAAALVAAWCVVAVTCPLVAATGHKGPHSLPWAIGWTLVLLTGAALIGATIGVFLHRPVLRNAAWSLPLAIGAVIAVALLPPVQDVLRAFNHDETTGVVALLAAAVAAGACATMISARLTNRFNN